MDVEAAVKWSRERWVLRDEDFGRLIKEMTADLWFAWDVGVGGERILVAWGRDLEVVASQAQRRGGYRELRRGFGDPVLADFSDQVFENYS